MKRKYLLLLLVMTMFVFDQVNAQSDNKFLVGLNYAGLALPLSKLNENRKGPFDLVSLNLQYNFGKNYSLLFGVGKRKIGAFELDPIFDDVDVSSFLKNEVSRFGNVRTNPSFNMVSLGISFPTFGCHCIHQTLNYDFLWTKKSEMPAFYLENSDSNMKLYKNAISGLRYSVQYKVAFPNNNLRLYFGPSIAMLGGTKIIQDSNPDIRMGVSMGAQYLIGKK